MNDAFLRITNQLATLSWLLISAILATMVWAGLPLFASAQTNGRVTGIVINGTTEQPVDGIEVTLSRFEQVGPESVDVTTTTDTSGRFEFGGLDTAKGCAYAVSARHNGVLYSTAMILLSQALEQEVELIVYESTTDDSVVSIQARGIVLSGIDIDEGTVTITDLSVISNASSRTYIGDDDGRTLRFNIPPNAVQVTPRPGYDFTNAMIEDATLFATSVLRPGVINATIDYTLPYADAVTRFPLETSYQVDIIRFLVPVSGSLSGVAVSTDGSPLADEGVVEIEGKQYHVWTADGLAPGDILDVSLVGLPETSVIHNELRTVAPALIAVSALVIASGVTGAVVVRRGLHRQRPVALSAQVAAPLDERRSELSAQLKELESRWSAGSVDEPEYRTERRMILEDLRRISRQHRGLGDDE